MSERAGGEPTLRNLIEFHRAWEIDPVDGGSGLERVQLCKPESAAGPRERVVRFQPDTLAPAARALQNADIRYQVEDMASQRGFCEVGEFNSRTAEGIKSRLIGVRGITTVEADSTALCDVLDFLVGSQRAGETEVTEPDRWLTVSQAARISGAECWKISRAAGKGQLATNGKARSERRIDKVSLVDWLLKIAEQPEREESDAEVEAKLRQPRR